VIGKLAFSSYRIYNTMYRKIVLEKVPHTTFSSHWPSDDEHANAKRRPLELMMARRYWQYS
jgi:hypothetical protein